MRKLAILSTDNLEDFFVYDRMLIEPLAKRGWEAQEVSWHKENHNWGQYDAVVVRSTWDYQAHCDAFLTRLREIDASNAQLLNPLKLIEWNVSKRYLKELEESGVPIVPTLWVDGEVELGHFHAAFSQFDTEELVIKPFISANADFTYRVDKANLPKLFEQIEADFKNRSAMIQPFIKSIIEEGEYSLFYFDGHYSHTICKQPAKGDFRVQEEHGGELLAIKPSSAMLDLAQQTIAALPTKALYARVDMVNCNDSLVIIEVELIEPSLYFNMDDKSAERFADIFVTSFNA